MVPREATKVYATVQNTGGGIARNLQITINSTALASQRSAEVSVAGGLLTSVEIVLTADDVNNGFYNATVTWEYEDSMGPHTGGPLDRRLYILPLVEFSDYGWEKIWPYIIWGKSEIGKNDTTRFYFRVQSQGRARYTNLSCRVSFADEAQNMSITPHIISIEQLGPLGRSEEYSFSIRSANAISGTYEVVIYLYSGEILVSKHTEELKVVPTS